MTVFIIKKNDVLNVNQDEIAIQLSDNNTVSSDVCLKAFHSVYSLENGFKSVSFEDLEVKLLNSTDKVKPPMKR